MCSYVLPHFCLMLSIGHLIPASLGHHAILCILVVCVQVALEYGRLHVHLEGVPQFFGLFVLNALRIRRQF